MMFSGFSSLLQLAILLGSAPGHANGAGLVPAAATLGQLCALHLQAPTPAQVAALGAVAVGSVMVPALQTQLPLLSEKMRSCVATLCDRTSTVVRGRPAAIGDLSENPWALTSLRVQHLIENPGQRSTNNPLAASQPATSFEETKDLAVKGFDNRVRLGLEVAANKQFNLKDILGEAAKAELAASIAETHNQLMSGHSQGGSSLGDLKEMPAFAEDLRRRVGGSKESFRVGRVLATFNTFASWGYPSTPRSGETLRGEGLVAASRSLGEFHLDGGTADSTGERYVCSLLGPPTLFVKNLPSTREAASRGLHHLEMVLNRIMPEDNAFTFASGQQCAPTIVQENGRAVKYMHAVPPGDENRVLLVIDVY